MMKDAEPANHHVACTACNGHTYCIITTHTHELPPVDLVSAEQGEAERTQIRAKRQARGLR